MLIRDAEERDLPRIVELVNAFLFTTTAEWTDTPYTVPDRRAWLERHRHAGEPVLVKGSASPNFIPCLEQPGAALGVPSGRYINILSDFMAANPGAPMAAAIRAWKRVKAMDSPKSYRAFAQSSR